MLVHNAGNNPVAPNIILRGLQQIQDGTLQQRRNPDGSLDQFQNLENNNDYRILEKNGQHKWVGPRGNVKGAGHFYGKLMNIPGCS
ncbi:hypothetical protein [Streptomyces niveiscabiei]|uniref:Uncharacterized protein n=1 Tax=Streptomyces niveiscabiei TaxID=164115 RepID=A0ABW9HIH5_9ACTN